MKTSLIECPLCEEKTQMRPYLKWKSLRWLRCPKCGGGIKFPYITELESDTDIVDSEYADFYLEDMHFSTVAAEKSKWISRNLTKNMAVVEPGAGNGSVAKAVTQQHPETEYYAIDPRIKDDLDKFDRIHVYKTDPVKDLETVLNILVSKNQPALIFLDNTLEHIPYPVKFISMLQKKCINGSRVLIEVPNETGVKLRASIANVLSKKHKSPTFPGHVNLFTPNSLKAACTAAGLCSVRHWINPLRTKDQIRYTMRAQNIPITVEILRRFINLIPFDSILGMGYWQRVEAYLYSPLR